MPRASGRFGHAIDLMQKGRMTTGGMRGGQIVDTTQETIEEYAVLKANLEATIAKVEADNA